MTLSNDIARCPSNGSPICENFRRREPGRPEYQTMIAPFATGDECAFVIPEKAND